MVILDIDFFKRYNDIYGHMEGDKCLREVARILINALRRPQDLAARYGGEEFAVILPETDDLGAQRVAEQIRVSIESLEINMDGRKKGGKITVSLGYSSVLPLLHKRPDALIQAADKALYLAKNEGRNCLRMIKVE